MSPIFVNPNEATMSIFPESAYVESGTLTTPPRRQTERTSKRVLRRQYTEVDPYELGNDKEEERNDGSVNGKIHPQDVQPDQNDIEGMRLRSELARDLIPKIESLKTTLGDPALAANLQILKRNLSRCYDSLRLYPREADFLSIVTLVESVMAQLKWKEYAATHVDTFRDVIGIGYRQSQVLYSDYEAATQLFAAHRINLTPRIDLENLELDEVSDDEETQATPNSD